MNTQHFDKFKFHRAISALMAKAQEIAGAEVRFSRDVKALEAAHAAIGKGGTGEHFRRALDTLPPSRFFWIGAWVGPEIIATVAARYDEISGWTLQQFIQAYWERTYRAADDSEVRLAEGSPDAAREFTGGFAYLGEAVTKTGSRHKGLSSVMVRLALLSAWDEWRPDLAYGYMRDFHAFGGLSVKWGFNGCFSNAFRWSKAPSEGDWHNLCLLSCDRLGFETILENPVPTALFDRQTNTQKENERPAASAPEE